MPNQITLTVIEGTLKGQQFIFDSRTTCIIGRASDCNIQIPNNAAHQAISRYHCLLDINPPDIRIRDFGSLHGTYVNDKCIGKRQKNQTPAEAAKLSFSEYDLQDGDLIKLSNTVFQIKIDQELAPTWIMPKIGDLPAQLEFNLSNSLGSIKNYTRVKFLGKGTCGEVFLARNDATGELVALKSLLPQVAVIPQMKERFLAEARLSNMLDHPNLVPLRDFYFSDGIFFFTMEFCDRGSVKNLMEKRGGKLSIREATDIILQVLDGLDYAHNQKGLVHRDIKPGNIFLKVNDGKLVAKLGDYGLAKAFDLAGLSGQTVTGTKMGTPVFMCRQQVLDFKYVQPDVDIWAIAASLYHMLTGAFPRDFDGFEPMLAILSNKPVPIRSRDPSIPKPLADLIDLALRDDPDLHFASVIAFKQALLSVI